MTGLEAVIQIAQAVGAPVLLAAVGVLWRVSLRVHEIGATQRAVVGQVDRLERRVEHVEARLTMRHDGEQWR